MHKVRKEPKLSIHDNYLHHDLSTQSRLQGRIINHNLFSRRLLGSLDPEAPAALAVPGHPAQHHVSDVRLPAGLRGLVLSQRRHVLHSQDRRLHPLQLRVSAHLMSFFNFVNRQRVDFSRSNVEFVFFVLS